MPQQLRLDLRARLTTGKKTRRIAVPASDDMVDVIDRLANRYTTTRAELVYQWIVDGIKESIGEALMGDLQAEKKLVDLL